MSKAEKKVEEEWADIVAEVREGNELYRCCFEKKEREAEEERERRVEVEERAEQKGMR